MTLPTYGDVLAAKERIEGHAVKTPLLRNALLDERSQGRIFLKAENLQRTGSFKFRGAMNALSALKEEGIDLSGRGVIACSSGNHAQGVAEAARVLGVSATIIMPSDAPVTKVERTKRSGANVIFYDRATEDRDAVTQVHTQRLGAVFVHPYENSHVIPGQGTLALEATDDLSRQGLTPDSVLVCTGGGGLSAGVALVMRERFPDVDFHTVEPVGFDDYRQSLEAGKRLSNARTDGSVCDAILTPMPGENSFEILRDFAQKGLIISDEEALSAVAFAFRELKVIVEPGGAAALAAILFDKVDTKGKTVLATISGGNIDPRMLQRALDQEQI